MHLADAFIQSDLHCIQVTVPGKARADKILFFYLSKLVKSGNDRKMCAKVWIDRQHKTPQQ